MTTLREVNFCKDIKRGTINKKVDNIIFISIFTNNKNQEISQFLIAKNILTQK